MATVKSLVSGFVGYSDGEDLREAKLETGQEFDADSVLVRARPELFTEPPAVPVEEQPQNTGRRRRSMDGAEEA